MKSESEDDGIGADHFEVEGGYIAHERNVCQHCIEERAARGLLPRWADQQYSFGYYAGRYCEPCWKESGYRDANDADAEFSEADAGESLHGEDY